MSKPSPTSAKKKTRQVILRLLDAVDRSIAAAEEAKTARDELTALSLSRREAAK